MSQIIELEPGQVRQYINAESVYLELGRTIIATREVRGCMFWREQSGTSTLSKSLLAGRKSHLAFEVTPLN